MDTQVEEQVIIESERANIFNTHPKEFGMTYFQHFRMALGFATKSFKLFIICTIHAVLPFILKTNFSDEVCELQKEFDKRHANHGK